MLHCLGGEMLLRKMSVVRWWCLWFCWCHIDPILPWSETSLNYLIASDSSYSAGSTHRSVILQMLKCSSFFFSWLGETIAERSIQIEPTITFPFLWDVSVVNQLTYISPRVDNIHEQFNITVGAIFSISVCSMRSGFKGLSLRGDKITAKTPC